MQCQFYWQYVAENIKYATKYFDQSSPASYFKEDRDYFLLENYLTNFIASYGFSCRKILTKTLSYLVLKDGLFMV